MKRTEQQNKALHLWFTQVAEALDSEGLSIQEVLAKAVDRPWTETSVKELMWRPIQKAMLDKESTTGLERSECSKVYEVLNRHLGTHFGVHVPFPSEDGQ